MRRKIFIITFAMVASVKGTGRSRALPPALLLAAFGNSVDWHSMNRTKEKE